MRLADRYDSLFQFYGEAFLVDWRLLKAQVFAESSFNPNAVSDHGAMGLAQFMPATWKVYGEGDPFNPEQSIKAQAKYMAYLLRYCAGDTVKALACYNWGPGNVARIEGPEWRRRLPKETERYIARIEERVGEE